MFGSQVSQFMGSSKWTNVVGSTKAGDLNALSKAASNAQQGFQQGITDFTGKAKAVR